MSKARKTRRSRKSVSVAPTPFNGDHGTGTQAALAGTVMEELTNEKGENPNHMARRRRQSWVEIYQKRGLLEKGHVNTAMALQEAFEATQKTREAIVKVQVDTTPKPDHAVTITIDRISRFHSVMRHVPKDVSSVISLVVLDDQPIESPSKGYAACVDDHIRLKMGIEKMMENMNG